jgi:hypothetical protein
MAAVQETATVSADVAAHHTEEFDQKVNRKEYCKHENCKTDQVAGISHPVGNPDQWTALRRPIQEHVIAVVFLIEPHDRRNDGAEENHGIPDVFNGNYRASVLLHDRHGSVNHWENQQHGVPGIAVNAENAPEHVGMIPVREEQCRNRARRNQCARDFPAKPLHRRTVHIGRKNKYQDTQTAELKRKIADHVRALNIQQIILENFHSDHSQRDDLQHNPPASFTDMSAPEIGQQHHRRNNRKHKQMRPAEIRISRACRQIIPVLPEIAHPITPSPPKNNSHTKYHYTTQNHSSIENPINQ